MASMTDDELQLFLEPNALYQDKAIEAARKELEIRGILNSSSADQDIPKPNSINVKTGLEGFPSKPIEEIKSQSLQRSFLSMALFIATFYLIFKWDLSYILVLVGVIFIHELGHFLAMRIFKYNDLGIFFVPLIGAFATGQKDSISQRQNVIILLSGPLPGVIIGVILYYFGLRDSNEFLIRTSNIFIFLNLFNLIPVMPFDGGRVIKSMFFENNELINKIFLFLSIAVLIIYSFYSQSYFLLVIPFFLLTQISNQSQMNKVKEGIDKKDIDINRSYEELTDEEYWLIRDEIGTHMKYFNRFITPKRYIKADNEQRIIKQVKAIVQKKPNKDLKLIGKILITLLWIMTFIVPIVMIIIYYIRLGVEPQ